jgi:hypothetical protein
LLKRPSKIAASQPPFLHAVRAICGARGRA